MEVIVVDITIYIEMFQELGICHSIFVPSNLMTKAYYLSVHLFVSLFVCVSVYLQALTLHVNIDITYQLGTGFIFGTYIPWV